MLRQSPRVLLLTSNRMTIEQTKRQIGADLLRQLIAGEITNDQFHRGFPRSESDAALGAIFVGAWVTYSDFREHRLTGKDTPDVKALAVLERCRLFLKSDLPFEWPTPKVGVVSAMLNLLSFGCIARRNEKRLQQVGDLDYWPFIRKADYEKMARTINAGLG